MKTNSTIYITNHRKKEADISPDEFYSTHPNSVQTFIDNGFWDHFHDWHKPHIWEPCCGNGNISKVLEKNGLTVTSTDLIQRDYGQGGIDFLSTDSVPNPNVTVIMTNPPFSLAESMIRHGLDILKMDGWIIMYLKLTFLEGKARYKLFQQLPPSYVYLHSSRQGCSSTGAESFANGGSVAYAWYLWEKARKSDTILRWLPPN